MRVEKNSGTFIGEPCIHGHGNKRYFSSAKECVECVRLRVARQRKEGKRRNDAYVRNPAA